MLNRLAKAAEEAFTEMLGRREKGFPGPDIWPEVARAVLREVLEIATNDPDCASTTDLIDSILQEKPDAD